MQRIDFMGFMNSYFMYATKVASPKELFKIATLFKRSPATVGRDHLWEIISLYHKVVQDS